LRSSSAPEADEQQSASSKSTKPSPSSY
jgi:hypothetical protein